MKPSEMSFLSSFVSAAASFGVLMGLISGIFFLVLSALRWLSRTRATLYDVELRRQKEYLAHCNPYLVGPRSSSLDGSAHSFGRNARSERSGHQGIQSRLDKVDGTEKEFGDEKRISLNTVQIRELIERLVEAIIGGPLDGITIGRLSTHSAYLAIFEKYHSLLCQELARLGFALHLSGFPDSALECDIPKSMQSNLNQLIKRIIVEVMSMPNIKEILSAPKNDTPEAPENIGKEKCYEDILATAILNKVVDSYQNGERKKGTKRRSKSLKKGDDDAMFNSDWSDLSRSGHLSLKVEQIEEVTTAYEFSEEEDADLSDFEAKRSYDVPFPESGRVVVDGRSDEEDYDSEERSSATQLVTSTNSWEENWLFQKKRLRSTTRNVHHPVPVPMLVPNPSENYRALVGGVDANDLSDMSDCGDSVTDDVAEEDRSLGTGELRQRSRQPSPSMAEHDDDDDLGRECEKHVEEVEGVANACIRKASKEETEAEAATESGSPLKSRDEAGHPESSPSQSQQIIDQEPLKPTEEALRCRTAEREKEKWNNPVEIPVNPYSVESIGKWEHRKKNEYFRLGTYLRDSIDFPDFMYEDEYSLEKSDSSRLRRDYYVNSTPERSLGESQRQTTPTFRTDADHQSLRPTPARRTTTTTSKPRLVAEDSNREFSLPNVKELAKHFAVDDVRGQSQSGSESETEKRNEKKAAWKPDGESKFNGKQVHSLTARSISREFREGLKTGCSQQRNQATWKSASEEDDKAANAYGAATTTPSFDLKNMRKFWEELITANARRGV